MKVQAVRGMNDLIPQDMPAWYFLEQTLRELCQSYGYQEVRAPLLEKTELFKRTIGDVTDIVEKEMYTFTDLSGDSLSLRPEGTAGCVRLGIQQGLLHNQIQRLWYMGPMYRHERPQKGRYRQFYQFGLEAFAMPGPAIDAEIILFSARLWQRLDLAQHLELQLNSLGSNAARKTYREALIDYFSQHQTQLDEDSQRRLHTNPLRILDSKNPDMQAVISGAPAFADYWDDESAEHFQQLRACLDAAGVSYTLNPRLVRGLDYYNRTVFEWVSGDLGAQATVCAGGRYDGLVEQLGGKATPAVGFAMGMERILELIQQHAAERVKVASLDVYIVCVGDEAHRVALPLSENLRVQLPNLSVVLDCSGGGLKAQFKRADKSAARIALVLGEQEVAEQKAGIKFLREEKAQEQCDFTQLAERLQHYFEGV